MAQFPDGRGVFLFGGRSDENDDEDRILELHVAPPAWKILKITLQHGRRDHVVIPLQP